jgi:hypothetical protein
LGVLGALSLAILSPVVAGAAEQETYYLGAEGIPHGELLLNPRSGELPNYDKGRDVKPGLLLERSDQGLDEEDETRFQDWQVEAGGGRIAGYPSLVIWGAAARFEPGKTGSFAAFLLDCNASATDCDEIGSGEATIDSGRGDTWVEALIDFPEVDHRFEERRYLAVRIVVSADSETDMMFAYGNTSQRSRLTIYPEPPVRPAEAAAAAETVAAPPVAPVEDVPVAVAPPAETELAITESSASEEPVWPWLVTLVLSTVALVAVGAVLMSSLTKPGRHERLPGGEHLAALARTGARSAPAR